VRIVHHGEEPVPFESYGTSFFSRICSYWIGD
jgi:hypothetical protein